MDYVYPFLPDVKILVLAILLDICRFENQRWALARENGLQGSSALVGGFVDWTRRLSYWYYIVFLISCGAVFGFRYAVGLWVLVGLSGVLYSVLSTFIVAKAKSGDYLLGGDNYFLWIVGTIAIWPICFILAVELIN